MGTKRAAYLRRKEREYVFRNRYKKASLYNDHKLSCVCAYCGEWADPNTQGDHVIPLSQMEFLAANHCKISSERVPCCKECNEIAGKELFKSFKQKKEFINNKYLKKYEKRALWEQEEIEELGRGLQAYVKTHAKQKNILFQQATYTNPSYIGEDHSNNKLFMKIYKRYGRHMKTKDSRRTLKTYNDPDMIKYPRVKISELTPGNYWDISKELMKCLVELEEIPFTVVNNVTVLYQGDVATWALQFRNGIKQKSKIFSAHRRLSHKS